MKKYLASIVLLGTAAAAWSQSKFDLPVAMRMSEIEMQAVALSRAGNDAADTKLSVIITFKTAADAEAFAAETDGVLSRRANMVIAVLPTAELRQLAERADILQISAGEISTPKMEVARANAGVDAVHAGTGLDRAFDGTGVIAGVFDTGIDPNHANFKSGDECRVKKLWTITGNTSATQIYDTPEKIAKFETDDKSETHGTHVLGIMAGSFKSATRTATLDSRGNNSISNRKAVPYYGVAPGAEIAACGGTFETSNTSLAASLIADYAKERNMPAVLNLSLGHNTGPHDGTTALNKYLAEVGKDIIICMSAGNEGATRISYSKNLTESDKQIKTCLASGTSANGIIDVWSSDAEPVTLTITGYNTSSGATPYNFSISENTNGNVRFYGGRNQADSYSNVRYDDALNNVFGPNALIQFSSGVNAANNRYEVYASVNLGAGAASKNVVPAITIEGKAGKTINLYSNAINFCSNNLPGYVDGNADGTISDLACGDNVLVVGSYTNREAFATLAGKRETGAKAGAISSFSSYGKTLDGRSLPHIAGPGEGMISSYSYYYIQEVLKANPNLKADNVSTVNHTHNNRASYWYEMSGTSMSSPFVAGVMALWLQANPELTIDQVKEILSRTAIRDAQTKAAPHRFGYGKIDALAGIKEAIKISGVSDITVDNKLLVSEVAHGCFDIFAPGARNIEAAIYGINGAKVAAVSANGENATISADGVAAGVYILRVNADGKTTTRKLAI